jgi:hypothetical protein
MMVQASPEMVGKAEYWRHVHSVLAKPESKAAYLDYLMNKDLTGFNPRRFPKTTYMLDTVVATRPMAAAFFQREIERAEGRVAVGYEEAVGVEVPGEVWKAREMFTKMNEGVKFPLSETRFGREMKKFAPALRKERRSDGVYYLYEPAGLKALLEEKHWLVEL